jgi:3-hydroxyisobutyrate dehydrogenase-like beta-hydroxyacid dehydrogenase
MLFHGRAMSKKVPMLEQNTKTKAVEGRRLGFIGLGYMGSRIAKRLIDAGHRLVVYNRDRRKAEALVSQGAQLAASPGELASVTDVILSCLSDGSALRNIYFSEDGVLHHAQPGTVIVEMSTVAPGASVQLAEAGHELGVRVLDVAISGSTPAAESGTLTLFGGGAQETFDAVLPLFPAIAKQWFYMGASGSGIAMKLVVNTLLGVGMQAMAEALALGGRLGLERRLLFDTLAKTAVVPPALVGKLASARESDYHPQFPARLMKKDFLLITSKAASLGVAMPATVEAAKIMAAETSTHPCEEDFSAVVRALERMANTKAERSSYRSGPTSTFSH